RQHAQRPEDVDARDARSRHRERPASARHAGALPQAGAQAGPPRRAAHRAADRGPSDRQPRDGVLRGIPAREAPRRRTDLTEAASPSSPRDRGGMLLTRDASPVASSDFSSIVGASLDGEDAMRRSVPFRRPLLAAAVCVAALAAAAALAQPPGSAARPAAGSLDGWPDEPIAVPLPSVSDEVTGPGPIFDSAPSHAPGLGPDDFDYDAREYFVSGTADG